MPRNRPKILNGCQHSFDNIKQVKDSPRLKSPGTPNSDWRSIEYLSRKVGDGACLNTDLGQSFKEIVADGDSFLTFASHSIFRYSSRVKAARQLIYISLRLSAAAQGEYGINRDRGRGVAKAGLVWPGLPAKGPFRSGAASAGVGLDNMMSVMRPCLYSPRVA